MSARLLDTSFLIDIWRGDPGALSRLEELMELGVPLVVTDIVVCEIAAGLAEADLERGRQLLRPLEFVQPGPETAFVAGRWRDDARRAGRTLSLQDGLIAAVAAALGATVVTRNVRDFALTSVPVETY